MPRDELAPPARLFVNLTIGAARRRAAK